MSASAIDYLTLGEVVTGMRAACYDVVHIAMTMPPRNVRARVRSREEWAIAIMGKERGERWLADNPVH